MNRMSTSRSTTFKTSFVHCKTQLKKLNYLMSSTPCQLNQHKKCYKTSLQHLNLPFHSSLRNSSELLMQARIKPFNHSTGFYYPVPIRRAQQPSHNEINNRESLMEAQKHVYFIYKKNIFTTSKLCTKKKTKQPRDISMVITV